jgi:hypothetical protein
VGIGAPGHYAALLGVLAGGMIWVSWPKKTSLLFKNLTENSIRGMVLPTGFVDVKVCAVDTDWSGLKTVAAGGGLKPAPRDREIGNFLAGQLNAQKFFGSFFQKRTCFLPARQ